LLNPHTLPNISTRNDRFVNFNITRDNSLEVSDDLLMARALRKLLPPYRGAARTLFRGESAWNRKRRTYGLSWSSDLVTAEGFARGLTRHSQGGSVVLKAIVPPCAIVARIKAADDRYGEKEFIVDRSELDIVSVVQRCPQVPLCEP
jgi:hypothetical protein